MRIKSIYLFCSIILLISGCAVMNTSLLETADTVEKGKVKFGLETNMGLDLTTAISAPEDSTETFDEEGLLTMPVIGLKGGIGLTDNLELNGKSWFTTYLIGGGSKVYLKYRFPCSNEKTSFAIAPGFSYIRTETEGEINEDESYFDVNAIGAELPFLFSYKAHENLIFYGAVRYSIDFIDVRSDSEYLMPDILRGTHVLHRFGAIIGLSINIKNAYIRPEIGFECAEQVNGKFSSVPVLSCGIGGEL